MAVSRRNFLLFAANDARVYEGPGERKMSETGFADDLSGEKRRAPVPVGAGSWRMFRAKCVGCLKCVPACPRGILRPSANPAHLGRPELRFTGGWCRPECNRCAAACPAGAIRTTANAAEKRKLHPNVALWHPDRCVAATGKDVCHACERHCPVKAIALVPNPGAAKDAPQVPRVDAATCIGCGACEHYCPARPKSAMSVEGRA